MTSVADLKRSVNNALDIINHSLPHNILITQKNENFISNLMSIELNKQLPASNNHYYINEYKKQDIIEITGSTIITAIEAKYIYTYNFSDVWAEGEIKDCILKLCRLKQSGIDNFIVLHCIHPDLATVSKHILDDHSVLWLLNGTNYFTYIDLTKNRKIRKKYRTQKTKYLKDEIYTLNAKTVLYKEIREICSNYLVKIKNWDVLEKHFKAISPLQYNLGSQAPTLFNFSILTYIIELDM